jgi:hypothetical protein
MGVAKGLGLGWILSNDLGTEDEHLIWKCQRGDQEKDSVGWT